MELTGNRLLSCSSHGRPLNLSEGFLLPSGKWQPSRVALSLPSCFSLLAVHFLNCFLTNSRRKTDLWKSAVLPALLRRRWRCSFTKAWHFLQDVWVVASWASLRVGCWRWSQSNTYYPMRKETWHGDWEVLCWPFLWEEPHRFFPRLLLQVT